MQFWKLFHVFDWLIDIRMNQNIPQFYVNFNLNKIIPIIHSPILIFIAVNYKAKRGALSRERIEGNSR